MPREQRDLLSGQGDRDARAYEQLYDQAMRWRDDRDRWHRLFNRIEAAISHHKRDCVRHDVPDLHDEALYAARDRVLRDSAEGKG